jgi:hypothetical protein
MMLYRDGSETQWDGRGCDTLVVRDADEADRALSEGWHLPADYLATTPVVPPRGDEPAADNELEELRAYKVDADELMKILEGERDEAKEQVADLLKEVAELREKLAAFDGDGDGQPGGSRRRKVKEQADG